MGAYYEDVYDEWFYYTHVPGFAGTTAFAAANAYAYYNAAYNEAIQYPLAPTDIGYSNTLDRTVEQLAVFGEFDYDVTEKLTVTAGARWADFELNEFESFQFPWASLVLQPEILQDFRRVLGQTGHSTVLVTTAI